MTPTAVVEERDRQAVHAILGIDHAPGMDILCGRLAQVVAIARAEGRAEERERCAKIADASREKGAWGGGAHVSCAANIAAAIHTEDPHAD